MARPKKQAKCHPERPHHCKGLCEECYQLQYRAITKAKTKEWHKVYYRNHKEDFKRNAKKNSESSRRRVLRKLGWTLEAYNVANEKQKELCAICVLSSDKALSADHDHATNVPRELLCNSCNLLLGYGKESPTVLEAAAAYLRKHGRV